MNQFDSYMLNKVRRLKDLRTRYAATGEKALLAGVPEEDREFVRANLQRRKRVNARARRPAWQAVNWH